jgi:putative ABC transport system permease protein
MTRHFAGFLRDVLVAARRLRRAPAAALLAVLVLALGVGATTALYALLRAVVLRPLPFADPDRLVVLVEDSATVRGWPTSVARLEEYEASARSFAGGLVGAINAQSVLASGGEAERLQGSRVSANAFEVLGVRPHSGRFLNAADGGAAAPPVVVLSEGLWRRRFGAAADLVGQTIDLDGVHRTVIGVAPQALRWPRPITDYWIPLLPTTGERNRGWRGVRVLARLAPGVAMAAAEQELRVVATAIGREFPDTEAGTIPRLVPVLEDLLGSTGPALRMLQGAVLLLLLVATANFANLLLVRAAGREGELAVRSALGGSRISLARLQLAETILLGVGGAVLGLALGAAALRVALASGAAALPRADGARIDGAAIGVALVAGIGAAVLATLVPVLAASSRRLSEALRRAGRQGGFARGRLLTLLIVIEIGAATALATGGGLLLRSVWRLAATESGVDPTSIVAFEIGEPRGGPSPAQTAAYSRRLLERLRETPGIDAVSAMSRLPIVGGMASANFQLEMLPTNPPGQGPVADVRYAEPGALPLLSVPRLAGRDIEATDLSDTTLVLLVNQAFVRTHFPDRPLEQVLGQRLSIGAEPGRWRTIVGVVGDVHLAELEKPVDPTVWAPLHQATFPAALRLVAVIAKSALPPADALARLREATASFDALQAISRPRPLDEAIDGSLAPRRLQAGLFVAFAAVAAALAAVGVYGVTADAVLQRRGEFGVRLALGADGRALLLLVLTQGARLAGIGVALGLLIAIAQQRLLARWLFGVSGWDPSVLAAVAAGTALAALGASFVPALRASRTAPAAVLRGDL